MEEEKYEIHLTYKMQLGNNGLALLNDLSKCYYVTKNG
jgi:hypothetical protein